MGALGSTNAPVLISGVFGVLGEEGLVANTTLAKWVGTATFGGEPMTSCVYGIVQSSGFTRVEKSTCDTPFTVRILLGEIKWDCEDVYVGK